MSATLFALALFGCSDDGTICRRLDDSVQTYRDRAACYAQTGTAVQTETALKAEYPTVYAQCLPSRQMAALGDHDVNLARMARVQFASAD